MPIQVEVWGDYACFTRPEMKTERVSYDVMTPSAARGLLESIYWHPGLRWVIDRIHVCAPIRFTNIRRNEVKDVISARRAKTVMEKGQGELYPRRVGEHSTARGYGAARCTLCHRRALRHDGRRCARRQSRQVSGHYQATAGKGAVLQHAVFRHAGISRAVPALHGIAAVPR